MIRRHVFFLSAALLIGAGFARADDINFDGPRLGHIFDPESKRIRPILGSPGAALVAPAADAPQFERAIVAGDGSIALGYQSGTERLVTIHPASPQREPAEIPDSMASFDMAALSPRAVSAIAYARSCNCIQVITNLRTEPKTSRTVPLPEGSSPQALGVNDDASVFAVADASGKLLLHGPEFTNEFNVLVSSIDFSADGENVAVVDSSRRTVAILSNLEGTPDIAEVASERDGMKSPAAVAYLTPSKLLVADAESSVHIVDLEANTFQSVDCLCRPSLIERTSLPDSFRVTNIDAGALWILQIAETGSRTLFIPAHHDQAASESVPEAQE